MTFANLTPPVIVFIISLISILSLCMRRWYKHLATTYTSHWKRVLSHPISSSIIVIRAALLMGTILFLSLAYLRPQWGLAQNQSQTKGVDIMFVLDVSKSMQAQDMTQGRQAVSRLTSAKSMIETFVANHPENRYGLIIFAGDAFVTTPLTFDHVAFNTFLNGVSSNDLTEQGTNLDAAIQQALQRLATGNQETDIGQLVVLVSDGGDEAENNIASSISQAQESGIKIITVGIGSDQAVPIPEGQDLFGRTQYKSFNGDTVMVKLNPEPLKEIANKTNGTYIQAKSPNDLNQITKHTSDLETNLIAPGSSSKPAERYQLFTFVAFLCFVGFLLAPYLHSSLKLNRSFHISKQIYQQISQSLFKK